MMDLNLERVRKIVEEKGYRKVIVHLPAGLMPMADKFMDVVPEPIFMANPCYGACDVPLHLLSDADAVFNFGHSSPAMEYPSNVHFFDVQITSGIPKFLPPFDKVGLVYVIQYRDMVEEYKNFLEKSGKKVILGGKPDFMALNEGQITGCDVGAARAVADNVDGFVVVSDGVFHAGAVASLGKRSFNWRGVEAEKPEYPLAALANAEKVGILVGTKPGQSNKQQAEKVRKKLEKSGKTVLIVMVDNLTPEVTNLPVDFWVVTACPRMAEDDFLKPSAPAEEVLKIF